MTPDEFVDGVRKFVLEAAVSDTIDIVADPPGRQPRKDLLELASWYAAVSAQDRQMFRRMLALASHAAVFGLFVAIDGNRKIVDAPPGHFELTYVHEGGHDPIAGPTVPPLHELLNAE